MSKFVKEVIESVSLEISFDTLKFEHFEEYFEHSLAIALEELKAGERKVSYSIKTGDEVEELDERPTALIVIKKFKEKQPEDFKLRVQLKISEDLSLPESLKNVNFSDISVITPIEGRDFKVLKHLDGKWRWKSCGDYFAGFGGYLIDSEEKARELAIANLNTVVSRMSTSLPKRSFADNYRDYLERYKTVCEYAEKPSDEATCALFIISKALTEGFEADDIIKMMWSNLHYVKSKETIRELVYECKDQFQRIEKLAVTRRYLVFKHKYFWDIFSAKILEEREIEGGNLSGKHDIICVEMAHAAGMSYEDCKDMLCSNSVFLRNLYRSNKEKDWLSADEISEEMLDAVYRVRTKCEKVFSKETLNTLELIAKTQPPIRGFLDIFDNSEPDDMMDLIDSLIKNLLAIKGFELLERYCAIALDGIFRDLRVPGTKEEFIAWMSSKEEESTEQSEQP